MPEPKTEFAFISSPWRWHFLAFGLILAAAVGRLFYLINYCQLDLAPDEAHYWHWSQQLDWSYYSKGPLVAYLIRLSCFLLGDFSRVWVGSEMIAVRVPAIVCGSLLLLSLYTLSYRVYQSGPLALAVVAGALTTPLIAAGSTLMTIDSPYTCCWGWALVFGHDAIFRKTPISWVWLGFVIGIGTLAKYNMVLWLPSLGLFLLFTPSYQKLLLRPGIWVATAITVVCCIPILWWNMEHDWVGLFHVQNLAGVQNNKPRFYLLGPLNYLAVQFAILLGFWFIVWARAMWHKAPWQPGVLDQERYLWWLSAPMFILFLLFGFTTGGGEANWPVAAYLSGMVLAAAWFRSELQSASPRYRRVIIYSAGATCAAGLFLNILLYKTELFYPILQPLAGPVSETRPYPMRRLDPTCRLRGWRTLVKEIDLLIVRLNRHGIDPVIVTDRWNLPGEIAFYSDQTKAVYCMGSAFGDRHSQYDIWRPNPVSDPGKFKGKTFIIVSVPGCSPLINSFEKLGPRQSVLHYEGTQPIAEWIIQVGHGFRGFSGKDEGENTY